MTAAEEGNQSLDFLHALDDHSQLRAEVEKLIADYPESLSTVRHLISHFQQTSSIAAGGTANSKKRKLEVTPIPTDEDHKDESPIACLLLELSFQMPRKKLSIAIYGSRIDLISTAAGNDRDLSILDRHFKLEQSLQLSNLSRKALLLPTPAKTQPHSSVVLMNKSGAVVAIFGFVDNPAANGSGLVHQAIPTPAVRQVRNNDNNNIETVVNALKLAGMEVEKPNGADFKSKYPSVHGTTATSRSLTQFHAECYMKAKDGVLYFLHSGIFYGFKKPVFLLHRARILNVAVENLTTRTFNLNIIYRPLMPDELDVMNAGSSKGMDDSADVSLSFDMIDNCEFEPIMHYLKRYQLDQIKIGGMVVEQVEDGDEAMDGDLAQLVGSESYDEEADEDFKSGQTSGDDSSASDSSDSNSDSDEDVTEAESTDNERDD